MSANNITFHSFTYPAYSCTNRPSITEHNGKLYAVMPGSGGILYSADGLIWEKPSFQLPLVITHFWPQLASFNGTLWCALGGNHSVKLELYVLNESTGKWETPTFTKAPVGYSISKLLAFFAFNQELYLVFQTGQSSWSDIVLYSTTDGATWTKGGGVAKTKSGGGNVPWLSVGSTAVFDDTLYFLFPSVPYSLQTLDQSTNTFQEVAKLPPGGINNSPIFSIASSGSSLQAMMIQGAPNFYFNYLEATDPSGTGSTPGTWGASKNYVFSDFTCRTYAAGHVIQDNFVWATSNPLPNSGDINLFCILSSADPSHLIPPAFEGKTINLTPEQKAAINITTIYPELKDDALTANFALGVDDNGNYYFASIDQTGGRNPDYYQTVGKPSQFVSSNCIPWIAYGVKDDETGNYGITLVPPGSPENHASYKLSDSDLFPPVLGGDTNQIVVQDTTGKLFVGTIKSNVGELKMTTTSYDLPNPGPIGPASAGSYLYLYDQAADVINIYNMVTTTDYGTPVATTDKLYLDSFGAGTEVKTVITNTYISYSIQTDTSSHLVVVVPLYQQGASTIDHVTIEVQEHTVTVN